MLKDFSLFSALFFDLDGTLVSGSDQHFIDCVEKTAEKLGYPKTKISRGKMLTTFLWETFPDQDTAFYELFLRKNKERMLGTERVVSYYPDAEAFLNHTSQYKRALVTNCYHWELELTMEKIDLSLHFSDIIFRRHDHEGKPDPALYLRAAELQNLSPKECLVFEDSEVGIAAGKSAGMTVVAIKRHNDLDTAGADMVISSFLEILPIFSSEKKEKV